MRTTWKLIGAGMVLATILASAVPATADTVSGAGIISGNRYRYNVPSNGSISYAVSIQVRRDPTGAINAVRGAARISNVSKAKAVQVDGVTLGTSSAAVNSNGTDANSSTTAISYTPWRSVAPGTCTSYRARGNFSVRWNDGGLSRFSILSPLTQVCRPSKAKVYPNCGAMNVDFPHGVGRGGARDKTSGTPVTNFYISDFIYSANASGRDADKDGIACERR